MQQDKVKASENMAIVAGEVQVYQNNKDANYEALAIEWKGYMKQKADLVYCL